MMNWSLFHDLAIYIYICKHVTGHVPFFSSKFFSISLEISLSFKRWIVVLHDHPMHMYTYSSTNIQCTHVPIHGMKILANQKGWGPHDLMAILGYFMKHFCFCFFFQLFCLQFSLISSSNIIHKRLVIKQCREITSSLIVANNLKIFRRVKCEI